MFEFRALRKIIGPKAGKVRGRWKILHKEEIHDLYFSPDVTSAIKPQRTRWGKREMYADFW
jgi:hypothetical protein